MEVDDIRPTQMGHPPVAPNSNAGSARPIVERLNPEEWEQLRSFPDGVMPDPKSSIAIVARDGDQLIGRVFIVCPAHIEGPYIDEKHRNGMLARRMFDAVEEEARQLGITTLFAYSVSDVTDGYLQRLGFVQLPWKVWTRET